MHCNSRNYKSIAEINLHTYNRHAKNREHMDICKPFLENFLRFEQLALEAENKEILHGDLQNKMEKMWEMIDWKGKADTKTEILIDESEVTPYFKHNFQSEKTMDHAKINDVDAALESYQIHIPFLDALPQHDELDRAIRKIGSGTRLDGIPSSVLQLMPQ